MGSEFVRRAVQLKVALHKLSDVRRLEVDGRAGDLKRERDRVHNCEGRAFVYRSRASGLETSRVVHEKSAQYLQLGYTCIGGPPKQ